MKKTIIFIAAAMGLSACSKFNDPELSEVKELVPVTSEVTVGAEGGTASIFVYSNGTVNLRQLGEAVSWATPAATSISGDGQVDVTFSENDGFRRMIQLELSLENSDKLDTLTFRQEGLEACLECASPFRTVDGKAESTVEFIFDTNVETDKLTVAVSYVRGGTDWIKGAVFNENKLTVTTKASAVESVSKARIDVVHIDGWGEKLPVSLMVTSSDKNGKFGVSKTFAEVKQLSGISRISDDFYIEGIVVSDCKSKNMDVNPSVDYNKVDVTESDRTAYIESTDGSLGFKIKFDNAADNTLVPGMLLTLGLEGTTVGRDNETVDACTISGVTVENMLGSEVSGVPAKVRKISELTDADVNTFVEIPNTEFVWKTGAYINIYENYAQKSTVNEVCDGCNGRFDCWAALLVDNENNAIYAPVNTLCLWRRDGKGVPQGCGSVRGIVVNNVMRRYGDVGRYQIRVLDEKGFCQSWDGPSAYETYAEWDGEPHHYKFDIFSSFNPKYTLSEEQTAGYTATIPSDDISADKPDPNGEMTCQIARPASNFSTYYSHCSKFVSGSGAGDRGRASAGKDKDTNPHALQLNNDIKGFYQWQGDSITGSNGITLKISTSELSGTGMYMSYAFCCGEISALTSKFFPAHWCTEYSIDGGCTWTLCKDAVTGNDYCHLHALPWYDTTISNIKYYSCYNCGLGATEHLAFLPDDVFGREDVRIRFRPYDSVMSIFPLQWDDDSETSNVYSLSEARVYLNLEYAMIRYRAL